jgi:hypothetical protein
MQRRTQVAAIAGANDRQAGLSGNSGLECHSDHNDHCRVRAEEGFTVGQ